MERDLTSGSVWKNIVYFSLPYLLSYFLQTLYGLADLFIVGQFDSVASTTAVSIGSQVMHMLTVMIVGLAMGTTVNIGRAVGATAKAASESSGKYHRAFCWRLSGSSSRFTGSGAANRACDVHTGGSGRRNGAVSYDLFYRNPVYHRV